MVIFIEEKKKQKRLIFVLIIALVITAFVLWFGFFRQSTQIAKKIKEIVPETKRVGEIDFTIFESQLLKELQLFPEIKPFKGEIGRENPFIPY